MKKFIYETNVPGLLPIEVIQSRINLWKRAGISTVFQVVDDGSGATWNSSVGIIDGRIQPIDAKTETELIIDSGFTYVPVFNLTYAKPGAVQRPELLLPNLNYYDVWNTEFIKWRIDYIKEFLNIRLVDNVGLDFVRSIIEEHETDERPAKEVVLNMIAAIKSIVHPAQLITISHLLLAKKKQQGIEVVDWLKQELVSSICVFHYNQDWMRLSEFPTDKIYALASSFKTVNSVNTSLTGIEVYRNAKKLQLLHSDILGYGVFTANMFTEDQSRAIGLL